VYKYVFKYSSVTRKSDGRYVASRKGWYAYASMFICVCVCYMCISTVSASMFLCACVCVQMYLDIRVLQKSLTAGTWCREWAVVENMNMVSFPKEPSKRDYILQKRPIILRSLRTVASQYVHWCVRVCKCVFKYPSVTEKSDGRCVALQKGCCGVCIYMHL